MQQEQRQTYLIMNSLFPTSTTNNTTITFGTNPGNYDITINYYSNVDIINALNDSSNIGSTATVGFYDEKNIADYRKLNNAYIRSDYEVGTAFIGLENKHVEVFADSTTVASPSSLTLTDIVLTAMPQSGNVVSTIDLAQVI